MARTTYAVAIIDIDEVEEDDIQFVAADSELSALTKVARELGHIGDDDTPDEEDLVDALRDNAVRLFAKEVPLTAQQRLI